MDNCQRRQAGNVAGGVGLQAILGHRDGLFVCFDKRSNAIVVVDRSGRILERTNAGTSPVLGIAAHGPSGKSYALELVRRPRVGIEHRVLEFDDGGGLAPKFSFDTKDPQDLCCIDDGRFLVLDGSRRQILLTDAQGVTLKEFGFAGVIPLDFFGNQSKGARGLDYDAATGTLYIAFSKARKIVGLKISLD